MNQILLNGINVEELLEKIAKLIDARLSNNQLKELKTQSQLLSRKEVSKLLKISYPTLADWTKEGWLQSYKIGNRVLYKLEEVETALVKVSNHKHKKGGLL
jgi:excisionase family DNA binding protein